MRGAVAARGIDPRDHGTRRITAMTGCRHRFNILPDLLECGFAPDAPCHAAACAICKLEYLGLVVGSHRQKPGIADARACDAAIRGRDIPRDAGIIFGSAPASGQVAGVRQREAVCLSPVGRVYRGSATAFMMDCRRQVISADPGKAPPPKQARVR